MKVLRLMRDSFLIAALSLQFSGLALAECDPKDFTIHDVDRIDFSNIVKYSGYSTLDENRDEHQSHNIEGSALINGAEYGLKYGDAKGLAEHILTTSGFSYDQDTRLKYVRTALSSIGAEMYANCLALQSIKVTIPPSAYSENRFRLAVSWNPRDAEPDQVPLEIGMIGGTINGKQGIGGGILRRIFDVGATIKRGTPQTFLIEKSPDTLQIDILAGPRTYPPIIIPPNVPLKKFTSVKRFGNSQSPKTGIGDVCTDHAYLVSEVGSAAGNSAKGPCRLCVDRSNTGFLLRSTAQAEPIDDPPHGVHVAMEQGSPMQMCATFRTDGAGINSGRFEINRGIFYLWEAVPN